MRTITDILYLCLFLLFSLSTCNLFLGAESEDSKIEIGEYFYLEICTSLEKSNCKSYQLKKISPYAQRQLGIKTNSFFEQKESASNDTLTVFVQE